MTDAYKVMKSKRSGATLQTRTHATTSDVQKNPNPKVTESRSPKAPNPKVTEIEIKFGFENIVSRGREVQT